MADVQVGGRLVSLVRREFDFVPEGGGDRITRDGYDAYIVGDDEASFGEKPTVVEVTRQDGESVLLTARNALVQFLCSAKVKNAGQFVCRPGALSVAKG